MKKLLLLAGLCVALAQAGAAAPARPAFADRPIRITVPFPPGGAVDSVARIVATHLAQAWGASVVVDNKAGAGGAIGVQAVTRAPATGNELLLGPIGPLTINPSLYPQLPYDTERDLEPIVLLAGTPAVLVVQPSLHIDTVPAFVAALKARPGQMNYGSAGNGNLTHLTAEYFLNRVGARANHIPYKGSAPAVTDFLGHQLDFMFDVVPTAQPHVRSGAFKALAVTSATRSSALPEVPTLKELGYADIDISSWWGLLAPRGTPREVIDEVNAEVNRGLRTEAVRTALARLGADPRGGTPAEFATLIHAEIGRWAEVVKRSGAKAD